MTTRERKERRLKKRREWAESREKKAQQAFAESSKLASGIPLGQPILSGHHSESRHRRDLGRIQSAMAKSVEHDQMAELHKATAEGIERQLDTSIYSDDTDAVERLQMKLDQLIGERARIKQINSWFRRHVKKAGIHSVNIGRIGAVELRDLKWKLSGLMRTAIKEIHLTNKEGLELANSFQFDSFIGFPPYKLNNLNGQISRTRSRLKELSEKGDQQ